MSTQKRNQLKEIMSLAWSFVRKNGYTMSEALKVAWLNMKLKMQMKQKIVRFYYRKVSGEIREAFGSLQENLLPETKGTGRKTNDTLFTYFDLIQSVANTVLSSVLIYFLLANLKSHNHERRMERHSGL